MAIDFVPITTTSRPQLGSQLIRAANLLKELRELVDGLSDASDHMNDGSDYTMFVTKFGLNGLPSGVTPANVKTLIGNTQEILNSGNDVTGANRLARLDEFVARLAGQ